MSMMFVSADVAVLEINGRQITLIGERPRVGPALSPKTLHLTNCRLDGCGAVIMSDDDHPTATLYCSTEHQQKARYLARTM